MGQETSPHTALDRLRNLRSFILASLRPEFPLMLGENNKVAYLDGLRGFAALLVYWTHHTGFAHDGEFEIWHAYGWNGGYHFVCLPFVRIFFHGGALAVALFFVISGYVLSLSSLTLIQSHEDERMRIATQLGCAFPRRWVRLYGPVIATTFIFMTCWHLFGIQSASNEAGLPLPTYIDEVMEWTSEFVRDSYFFRDNGFTISAYNTHLWSIATEYHGSAIVYVLLLGFTALDYTATARFWSCLGLGAYFLFFANGPAYALFILGLMLCDLALITERDPTERPRILTRVEWLIMTRWFPYILLIAGLYFGSVPHVADPARYVEEPGWAWMAAFVPQTATNARKYVNVGAAALTMIAIPQIHWLRRFFESFFCQYLGKISFGLYLIHGPVMWTVGDRLLAAVGRPRRTAAMRIPEWIDVIPMSDAGPLGLEINALVPQIILLPLTFWLAGVVTKLFDQPSAVLAKKLFPQVSYKRSGWRPEIA